MIYRKRECLGKCQGESCQIQNCTPEQCNITPRPTKPSTAPPSTARPSTAPPGNLSSLTCQCGQEASSNSGLARYFDDPLLSASVNPHQYPWMVLIVSMGHLNTILHCGGALISDRHILTEIKCIRGPVKTRIYLGEHDISKKDGQQAISMIKSHPMTPQLAIISIIPIVFTDENRHIRPICLPTNANLDISSGNEDGIILGWSISKVGGGTKISNFLNHLSVKILKNQNL